MLCEMCRSVSVAKRPPPRVFARHRSRRVSTNTTSDVASDTPPPSDSPPPAASCDDVALASAIVTLDRCTMLPLEKMAPPYCAMWVDERGAQHICSAK
eukprot:3729406-Prymnesium_polylepis.4